MIDLKIIAVGSSLLIADEIKSIITTLLGNNIQVRTLATKDVLSANNNTFYVCATTQKIYLQNVIPNEQLFIFDLHPTTKFFLDIAKIPYGETVHVFNNLLPYTELLAKECNQLGITQLKFQPIAYDEMPSDEVYRLLKEANYIIGVDCLMGSKMLFSEKYRHCLQSNIYTIAGKRAASVASASNFISAIANYYYIHLLQERNKLTNDNENIQSQIENLSVQITKIIHILKYASNQAVTNQIGLTSNLSESNENISQPYNMKYLDEQLNILHYLCQKVQDLS